MIKILEKCPNPNCTAPKVEAHGFAMVPHRGRMRIECTGCYCLVDMPTSVEAIAAWNASAADAPAILNEKAACVTTERFQKLVAAEATLKAIREAWEAVEDDARQASSSHCEWCGDGNTMCCRASDYEDFRKLVKEP